MAARYTAGCCFDQLRLARNGYDPFCYDILSDMSQREEWKDKDSPNQPPWTNLRSILTYLVLSSL